MKVYLVGGAVRDELLGRSVKDRDYVVVGATPQEMFDLGYKQVGADFPVFLHPNSGEEYALARTERKTGKGYQGFTTDFDPSITLEDDLRRRDLTINAMAKDLETGELIDPFNGLQDLKDGVLRHVSEAFQEDPLRVLRIARFRARYNFKIAPLTMDLMTHLVQIGELNALTPERVWTEMEKGFSEGEYPTMFIRTLMECEAWGRLFPDVRTGGTFYRFHNILPSSNFTFAQKLMIMFSDTPQMYVAKVLEQYKASADDTRLVLCFKKLQYAAENPMTSVDVLNFLKKLDAFRRPEDFEALIKPAFCFGKDFPFFVQSIHNAFHQMQKVTFASLSPEQQRLKGAEIGKVIDQERLKNLL